MLNDWYSDYLRMIHPRSPADEIEFFYRGGNLTELIDGATDWFNVLMNLLTGNPLPYELRDYSNVCCVLSCIEWFGALRSFADLTDSQNLVSDTIISFEKYITENIDQVRTLFVHQIDMELLDRIKAWKVFVNETKHNVLLGEIVDWIDIQCGLSDRTLLQRLLNVADGEEILDGYRKTIDGLDREYQDISLECAFVGKISISHFFFKQEFWWYWVMPRNIKIDGRPSA